jgi:VWFA-related protein
LALTAVAQQQSPTPPIEETVRIRSEEVHLTMLARGAYPGVLPKLRPSDIVVYEDGVAQTITSMRTVPPSVLVVLDTGAALTFAKSAAMVTLSAKILVENLPDGTSASVMQYSEQPHTIAAWTDERMEIINKLDKGVKSGRRSLLSDALRAAVTAFDTRPLENRHLILVTDGLDGHSALKASGEEFRRIAAANIVVHVISYTDIEQKGAERAGRRVKINTRRSKPRVPEEIFDDMIRGVALRAEAKASLKAMNEAQQIIIVDLDSERRKMLRGRREEWSAAEDELRTIAGETGGSIDVPISAVDLWTSAAEVARSIGSYFDVTYTPAKSISESGTSVRREILVESRVESVRVRTRRTLIARHE